MMMLGRHLVGWVMLAVFGLIVAAVPAQQPTPAPLPQRPLPSDVKLSASVDVPNAVIGDRLRYSIEIEGNVPVDQYDAPPFQSGGGLELVDGPSQQTQLMMTNGRTSQRFSLVYTLRAVNKGTYTIPPARVRINGVWYDTNEVSITIGDIPQQEGDLAGIISAQTNDPRINQQLRNRYFAQMEVPDTAYHGQAVPVKVFIYRDPSLPEFIKWRLMKNLAGSDFIIPDVLNQQNISQTANWEQVSFSGKTFERTLLFTVFAVPTKNGALRLTPPMLSIYLPVDPRYGRRSMDDLFDMMMQPSRNSIEAEVQMRPADLNVKAPPEKPADAVMQIIGDANVELTPDRSELPHRELLTLSLKVSGEGFFDLLSKPDIPTVPNLSLVDTQASSDMNVYQGHMLSKKSFDYIYQAASPGDVEIPPIKFAVFNPDTGQQKIIETNPIPVKIKEDNAQTVQIAGGATAPASAGPTENKADAKVLGTDVSYIDTEPLTAVSISAQSEFYLRPWFWLLQLIPALGAFAYGTIAFLTRRGRPESDASRTRRGRKAAAASLREAQSKIPSANRDEFYATMHRGIMSYAASLLKRSEKGITAEETVDQLLAAGYADDVCRRLADVLKRCDAMRYSPATDDEESRRRAIAEAESLLVDLGHSGGNRK